MAEIAISVAISLIEKVIAFLAKEVNHTFGDVEDIKTSLTTMQALLRDAERAENSTETMKNLTKRIKKVSLEIEDVLDEFMAHAPRHNISNALFKKPYSLGHNVKHWIPLHSIQSKMQGIRNTILGIQGDPGYSQLIGSHSTAPEGFANTSTPEILEDDEIVGMKGTKDNLISDLKAGNQWRRTTVAVVGPPGSGKTVLANNVFRSSKIRVEFECFAWINVPPVVNGDISQRLLAGFEMGSDERRIPLIDLKRELRGKRYIVVVDNIRIEEQWRCIERELPNDSTYSRIIITTTDSQVAAVSTDLVHRIDGLGYDDSLFLFCQKAFKSSNGHCPSELVDIAKKIVKRCEGIPLAIVDAGNLLSRKMPLPAAWEKVHDNLSSEIETSSRNETLRNKLLRIYKDLSSNLKNCFLYFSIFPEDCCVSCARLIRLWVAEGFVNKTGQKTLEETSEDYLNELIARNLVQARRIDFDGRVRSCRVRYLVHEFAIKKSLDENFTAILTESDSANSSEKLRRLSLRNFNLEKISSETDLDLVRTLTAFWFRNDNSSGFTMTVDEFKLLKVLDLQGAPMQQFPAHISKVTLLRYLSLRGTDVREVPTIIHELHYLEYLDLKHTHVRVLPGGVCTLQKLRQLLVCSENSTNSNTFDNILGADVLGSIGALPFLQKLTLIKAKDRSFIVQLGHLEQLQKLGLVELRKEDGKQLCQSIMQMKKLSVLKLRSKSESEYLDLDHMMQLSCKLQSLSLKGCLRELPSWINKSLSSVVRIKLEWSRLDKSPVEVLQNLPNLIELQMVEAFCGQALIFGTGSFQKLKTLRIERFRSLDIVAMLQGAMPNLQKLTVVECVNLRTLPGGIEHLKSLKKLQVSVMHQVFTSRLEKGSADRGKIDHIAKIIAFYRGADGSKKILKDYSRCWTSN